ncbi:MAG: DUF4143 domain-containing protein [Propionibacteriaceae bacterium]|nr:DUF4143 domain-containing protein [Propionibacteriaceae bacterium]
MSGLSQGEIHSHWDDFAAAARDLLASPHHISDWNRSTYANALGASGYPEVLTLDPRVRRYWMEGYLGRMVTRDLPEISSSLAANRLSEVLRLVAAAHGSETVPTRMANDLGMPASSIGAYLTALRTLHLIDDLPPWTPNLTTREIGRHKLSVSDSALAMHLGRVNVAALETPETSTHLGGLLEMFVVSELMKQKTWSSEDLNLYHYRNRGGVEVDLVIEYADGRVFLIEVKASQTYQSSQAKSIRTLAEKLGDRFLGGAVLTLAHDTVTMGDKIWGMPVSALWEMG